MAVIDDFAGKDYCMHFNILPLAYRACHCSCFISIIGCVLYQMRILLNREQLNHSIASVMKQMKHLKKINPVNFMSIQIWVFQLTSPTLHRVWRKYWPWYECIHLPVCFIIYCILSEIAFWYCLLYNYYWETWYQLNIYSDIFLFLADWYARLTFICCTKLTVLRSAIEKIYILVTYCLHLTALSENKNAVLDTFIPYN